jgi:ferredoxin
MATILTNRCPQNHPCPAVRSCPVGALKQVGTAAPTIDKEKCTDCGKCTHRCPTRALQR